MLISSTLSSSVVILTVPVTVPVPIIGMAAVSTFTNPRFMQLPQYQASSGISVNFGDKQYVCDS